MMNQAEIVSRIAIADLVNRYAINADLADYDEIVKCFAEDAVLSMGRAPAWCGREQIKAGFLKNLERRRGAEPGSIQRHNITSSLIEFAGDSSATGRTYVSVFTELGFDHFGVYNDRFARYDGKWLIAARSAELDFIRPDSRFAVFLK